MKDATTPAQGAAPALGFSVQVALDKEGRRTIVFQSHVGVEDDSKALNAVLDKVMAAADRQIDAYRLSDLIRTEQEYVRQLAHAKEDLVRIDKQHQEEFETKNPGRPFRAAPPQKAQREAAVTHIDRGSSLLDNAREDIAALKEKLK